MIIKDWQYDKFLNDLKEYNSLLIYGPDRGLVKEKSDLFLNNQININNNSLEVFKLTPEDLAKTKNKLFELAYQKPIFFKKSLIHIDLDLVKNLSDITEFLETLDMEKANFILLESANLKSDSKILKLFKNKNNFAVIACYHDNSKNLFNFINNYTKELGLVISKDNIEYLCQRLGNDRLITKKELDKLAIFANNQPISYEDILNGIGDNTTTRLDYICDNLFIKDFFYINSIIDKAIDEGANFMLIIRTITNHVMLLFKARLLSIKNVKDIYPPIHFSRHTKIQKQLSTVDYRSIEYAIENLNLLESNCKTNPDLARILLKKFVEELPN